MTRIISPVALIGYLLAGFVLPAVHVHQHHHRHADAAVRPTEGCSHAHHHAFVHPPDAQVHSHDAANAEPDGAASAIRPDHPACDQSCAICQASKNRQLAGPLAAGAAGDLLARRDQVFERQFRSAKPLATLFVRGPPAGIGSSS